jgi:hypothetical protein
MKTIFHLLLTVSVALSNQLYASGISTDTITVRSLPETEATGTYPVCTNGLGDLLPCDDGIPPPPPASLIGIWEGRMLLDSGYSGIEGCHNADVQFYVENFITDHITSMIVKRDIGGIDIIHTYILIPPSGYLADYFYAFGERHDFTLEFNGNGYASGIWVKAASSEAPNCYGEWSLNQN